MQAMLISCLSQKGSAAGLEDSAARGAITASSTADAAAHGANMAVDGNFSIFGVRPSIKVHSA